MKEINRLSNAKVDFRIDNEVAGIGAGLGGGFYDTSELRSMKFKEAIENAVASGRISAEDAKTALAVKTAVGDERVAELREKYAERIFNGDEKAKRKLRAEVEAAFRDVMKSELVKKIQEGDPEAIRRPGMVFSLIARLLRGERAHCLSSGLIGLVTVAGTLRAKNNRDRVFWMKLHDYLLTGRPHRATAIIFVTGAVTL